MHIGQCKFVPKLDARQSLHKQSTGIDAMPRIFGAFFGSG